MVDASIVGVIQRLGFTDILLWLLSFAVVYGILSQINVPKSKPVQAIIAIVASFFVLMAAPGTLITVMSQLSISLLVVILGILLLLIFIEVGGIKHYEEETAYDEKGKPVGRGVSEVTFVSKNMYILGITLILIAVLVFIGAGGSDLLGLKIPYGIDITGVMFFIAIIIAILWMIKGEKKK